MNKLQNNEQKTLWQKIQSLQNEIPAIPKDEINPFFKSKYFDINKVIETLKPILEKYSLVVMQPLTIFDHKPALKTIVIDSETGEKIEDIMFLTETPEAQKMGGVITYFRRYALQSMLFLQAEDDDGNTTAQPPKKTYPLKKESPKGSPVPQSVGEDGIERPQWEESCTICGGAMWDNRTREDGGLGRYPKTNPKAPDWKCRNSECSGMKWITRKNEDIEQQTPPPIDEDEILNQKIPF